MKKKSGAAQRLVSLVLALGLIFTLAPASVFAGDEAPASSTVTATAGEEPVVDTTEPVVDNTEPAVDGTEPVVDDSEPVADSTEPAEEPAVEQDALKPAKVAAPAPAALGSASPRGDYGISFIFSNDSSDGVRLWYATREYDALGVRFEVSELKELTRGDSLDFAMLEGRAAYFFVYIPEGYELDELQISESLNAYETLPLTDGYKLEEFEGRQAEAMAKGCTYGFYFSGTGNLKNTEITVTTKPITNIYTVDKSQDFESTGVDIVEELPVEVKEGESLQLTVYGPNDLGVTKLIQSLTVLDGTEEKALQLPLNADDTPAVTQLNGGTVTVTYHDVVMVKGLLRTKYTIDVTNVQGDITFNSVDCRKWVDKAVNVNELEGIAALEYCGPDGKWQSFDVNSWPDQVPFFTCDALDFIKGHYQVVNFRFKLQDGYENPQLELTKKNGTIDKGELKPDADGWYNFNITIGAKWTDDDILVWFGDDTYQVDMFLTAEKTTTTTYPAKFYVHEAGSNVYYPVGNGTVDFGEPTWDYEKNPIDLNIQENLNKVLTAPEAEDFGKIPVDGVFYEFSATAGVPNTYTFEGWDVAKTAYLDQSGPDAILEWHVDGIIVLHKALPNDMKPEVADFEDVYDGTAKTLSITYPEGKTEDDYTIEYQDANGNWVVGNPTLTNVDKLENIKIRFTMDGYAPYEALGTYTLEVTKRPITLKANDDKISDGDPIPKFTFTITSGSLAEGDNIIDVTYGGYANKLGIYDLVITGYKIVDAKDNNADVTGNYEVTLLPGVFTIGTAGGGGGTTPTPNPNPNPTPVPVPVEPETPVTPVAPVTPDEEEEEPAEVEDIEEEETPQASPDTDADKEEDKTENIEDEETAQAGAPGEGNWALLNLILMVLTVVAGLAMLALRFARKTGMAHLLGIVPAIVALVAFFVTEDMSLPMAMTDKWTLIMALIAVVQVVLLVLGRNGVQEDDQPREQY